MISYEYQASFAWAWCRFFKKRIPGLPAVTEHNVPSNARWMVPVAGAAAGLMVVLATWIVGFFMGKLAASLFAAVAGSFFLEFIRGFSGLKAACAWIAHRQSGASPAEALDFDEDDPSKKPDFSMQIIPVTIFLVRGVLFGFLTWNDASCWILFALTGGFLVMAELSGKLDSETWQEYIPCPPEYQMFHWYSTIAVLLAAGILSLHLGGAIMAFLVAWGMSKYVGYLVSEQSGTVNRHTLNFFGYFTECMLLVIGILMV